MKFSENLTGSNIKPFPFKVWTQRKRFLKCYIKLHKVLQSPTAPLPVYNSNIFFSKQSSYEETNYRNNACGVMQSDDFLLGFLFFPFLFSFWDLRGNQYCLYALWLTMAELNSESPTVAHSHQLKGSVLKYAPGHLS